MDHLADLDDMLDPDDFGAAADFSGTPVNGIYDAEPVELDTGSGFVMSTSHTFTCKQADLPAWVGDDTPVSIEDGSFKVRKVEPDGSGLVELYLEVQ